MFLEFFFIFQRLMSSPVTGLLTVCIDTIIVLLCVWQWDENVNNPLGIPWEWEQDLNLEMERNGN